MRGRSAYKGERKLSRESRYDRSMAGTMGQFEVDVKW